MRKIWHILVRTIFWSFERGTWPYDVAVALIVIFVLLSPRSWFHDRPSVPLLASAGLRSRDPGSSGKIETYRVDARALDSSMGGPGSELERDLRQAVRRNVKSLKQRDFEIVRIIPVRDEHGTVAYYDVSVKP
jgi:hypothetical protein